MNVRSCHFRVDIKHLKHLKKMFIQLNLIDIVCVSSCTMHAMFPATAPPQYTQTPTHFEILKQVENVKPLGMSARPNVFHSL